MATRYWVGGSGTWSSTTKWSATSGGASGASVPTSADDVIFDANSASATFTVTISATANCASFTVTGTNLCNVTSSSLQILNCYGNLICAAGFFQASQFNEFRLHNSNSAVPLLIDLGASRPTGNVFKFFGTNGLFRFISGLYTSGTLYLGSGGSGNSMTIDFNGQSITGGSCVIDGSGTDNVTVTLGTSTLVLQSWSVTNPNLVLNAAASTISVNGINTTFAGNGLTYGVVRLNVAYGTITVTGNNTFGQLYFVSGTTGNSAIYEFPDNQTINQLRFDSSNEQNALTIRGTQFNRTTFTVNTLYSTFGFVNFENIAIAGSLGTLTGTNLGGSSGSNTNISGFAASRTLYWVTNSSTDANFNSTWGTSPTNTGVFVRPRPQDTLTFTDNYPAAGGNVNFVNWYTRTIPTINASARTTTINLSFPTSQINLGGSLTLSSAVNLASSVTTVLVNSDSAVSFSLQDTWGASTIRVGDYYPTTLNLARNFSQTSTIILTSGAFNTNNYAYLATDLRDDGSTYPRSVNLGSSLVTLSSATPFVFASSNLTFNAGTSTIRLTRSSAKTFAGGGRTYYNLDQGGSGSLTITGSNTFNDITHSYTAASSIFFESGSTTTLSNLSAAGTASYQVTLSNTTGTTRATLSKSSGTVTLNYVTYSDLNATGGATWQAFPSNGVINGGNNLGWTTSQTISLAAVAAVAVSKTAALSKNSNLSTITSAAASATAALRKFANLSYIGSYADTGYVAPDYFKDSDIVVTATARLSTTLASSAVSVATAAASLDKTSRLAAAAVSVVTPTVALTKSFTLASSAVSGATATASLGVVNTLSGLVGTAAVTNVINATLSQTVPLAGSTVVASTTAADLVPVKTLASTVALVNTSTALLELNNTLGSLFGTAAVTNVISANLLNSYTLASSAASVVTVSGTTDNTKPLAANAVVVNTATVALGKTVELAAEAFSECDVVIAAFSGITGLAASGVTAVTATGNINISKPLAASAAVSVSTNTTLYRNFKIFAVASVSVTATATVTHNLNLSYALYIDSGYVDPGYLQEGNVVTATGRLATTMRSAAVSATTATGDLQTTKVIAATAVSRVASTANLTTSYVLEPLTGLGAVTNVVNATLAVGKVFASSVTCLTVIEGGLSLLNNLAAAVSAITTVEPAPTTVERGVAANAASFSSASGSVSLTIRAAGTALALATVNGRLVVAHANELEGLGTTSADITYRQILVDAQIANTYGDVSYESVIADVVTDGLYVEVADGLIYAETEVFENDLVASTTPANIFVYKQAA